MTFVFNLDFRHFFQCQCLLYYTYSNYCIHVFFSFPNYHRCHTCMFLIKHPIYNDWSIGMRVYVNCVCRLSRFFFVENKFESTFVFTFT